MRELWPSKNCPQRPHFTLDMICPVITVRVEPNTSNAMKQAVILSFGMICLLSVIGSASESETGFSPVDRTITDSQGREVEATIIRLDSEETLTFRRKSDGQEFTIDIGILSEEDKLFVESLRPSKNNNKTFVDAAIDKTPRELGEVVGNVAPDFYFETPEGTTSKLSDLKGSNVIIMTFLVMKDGPIVCNADPEIWDNMPARLKLAKERGVKIIFINTWTVSEMFAKSLREQNLDINDQLGGLGLFINKNNLDVDGHVEIYEDFGKIWRFSGNPNVGIVGKDGKVLHDHSSIVGSPQFRNLSEESYRLKALDAALEIVNALD